MGFAKGKGHKKDHKKIFKQLELTKEQKVQLKTMRKNSKGQMKSLRTEKKKVRKELKQAMRSNTPDTKLRSLHNEITRLQNKIKDQRFEKMLAIRKILTPEQREKFFDLKSKMRKKRKRNL
jgi:Spy/CpxP family protein refolding chaperone